MNNKRRKQTGFSSSPSGVQIWTLVSVVEDSISSSIHLSECDAYSAAVARFEAADLMPSRQDRELRTLLQSSIKRGDYQDVRQYIAAKSCHLRLLQLTEHHINAMNGYHLAARLPIQRRNSK
jgi:hypothetical protein